MAAKKKADLRILEKQNKVRQNRVQTQQVITSSPRLPGDPGPVVSTPAEVPARPRQLSTAFEEQDGSFRAWRDSSQHQDSSEDLDNTPPLPGEEVEDHPVELPLQVEPRPARDHLLFDEDNVYDEDNVNDVNSDNQELSESDEDAIMAPQALRDAGHALDVAKTALELHLRTYQTAKNAVNHRGVYSALSKARTQFEFLPDLAFRYFSLITVLEDKHSAMDDWITYEEREGARIKAGFEFHASMEGAVAEDVPEAMDVSPQIKAQERKVTAYRDQITNEIEECYNALRDEFPLVGGQPGTALNKLQSKYYSGRISTFRTMIEVTLGIHLQDLCALNVNKADTYHSENTDALKTINTNYNKLIRELTSKRFEEDCEDLNHSISGSIAGASSISTFRPASSSTQIQPVHHFQPRNTYKYDSEKIPEFHGDFALYPHWRKEWKNSVMIGKDDAWIMRNLAAKVQIPGNKQLSEKLQHAGNPDKAFQILDDLFANPTVVTQKITKVFTHLQPSDLDNFTAEAQMCSLESKWDTLRGSLEAVGKGDKLETNDNLLFHAIDLMPKLYRSQFNAKRQSLEKEAKRDGTEVTAKMLVDTWTNYMEDACGQIRMYEPDTLVRKKAQTEARDQGDGARKSKKENALEKQVKALNQKLNNITRTGSAQKEKPGLGGSVPEVMKRLPETKQKAIQEIWAKQGKCPLCKEDHLWKGTSGVFASSQVNDCPTFRKLPSVDEKIKAFKKHKLCRRCLSWTHTVDNCTRSTDKMFCRNKKPDGSDCKEDHATLLHGGSIALHHLVITKRNQQPTLKASERPLENVMLAIVSFPITATLSVCILLDNGSNGSLITHYLAKLLKLKGIWVDQWVELAGQAPKLIKVAYYKVEINLGNGDKWQHVFVGMDRISSAPGSFNVQSAYQHFPHIEQGALDKPNGDVQMLFGADQVKMLPSGGEGPNMVGNLRVFNIPFAPYKVLVGSHPEIKFVNPILSDVACNMRQATFHAVRESFPLCINAMDMPSFLEAETLPYDVPPKCKKCKECANCSIQEEGITVKEFQELQMLRDAVRLDKETHTIHVKYPIIGDISKFHDNRHQAEQRCDSLIKSLEKKGMLEAYTKQVEDFIERGVWKKTSIEEIEAWKAKGGRVHYVSHHGVQSPSSSTPLRIVVDSSLRNNYTGPRLSSLYAKGPNQVANLFKTMLGWLTKLKGGTFDLSKAYHQMKTGEEEFYMRLVVWKNPETGEFEIFGHCCVGFGCVPASVLLEISKEITAEEGEELDPELASQLIDLSYVDDGMFGGTEEQVKKWMGELIEMVNGKPIFDGLITQMLAITGFKPKFIMISGETRKELLDNVGQVLGVTWEPTEDVLSYQPAINITKKVGAGRAGPDLTPADLPGLQITFTRRLALGIISQLWDPLGHLTCFTIRYKILMKELVDHETEWDKPLPEIFQQKWRKALEELVNCPAIKFPRSLMTDFVIGRPELLAFFDGSDQAFGCVIYIRWRTENPSKFYTTIVTSKARVTPKGGTTTPRSELSGLMVAIRVMDKVIRAIKVSYTPARVTIAGDSKCTVTCVSTNAAALNPYFANRSLETNIKMGEWGPYTDKKATYELTEEDLNKLGPQEIVVDKVHYIPGPQNPGDAPTRGSILYKDLDMGKIWQTGPDFIMEPRDTWPLSDDFVPTSVPPEERRKRFTEANILSNYRQAGGWLRIFSLTKTEAQPGLIRNVQSCMERTNVLTKAIRIVARLLNVYKNGNERLAILLDLGPQDLLDAKWIMAITATVLFYQEIEKKDNLESLNITFREGLPYTQGRMSRSAMIGMLGHSELLVLSKHSRLAYLVMTAAHNEDHRLGPGDAVYRSVRMGYWILQSRKLAEQVVKDCRYCKIVKASISAQRMGDLPNEMFQVPVRPFTHITLDFAGAIMAKGDVNQRTHRKTFPLIFVCLNTQSIHVALARDMSTDSFLTQLSHFFAIRGKSAYIYSDMGSNITSASRRLSEPEIGDRPNMDWAEIKRRTSGLGIKWTHSPARSQWRDGRSEAAVKQLKHTLRHLNVHGDMFYSELACLLARAADIINDRPLGLRHHSKASPDLCVVTPNLLLQGSRTCEAVEHDGDFAKDMANLSVRLGFMQKSFEEWWHRWITAVWPSLVPYRRWKTTHRNIRTGDLVLVQYANKYSKAEFRRGVVLEVYPDEKDVVRTVLVGCRPRSKADRLGPYKSKALERMTVPVQRLSVLLAVEERDQIPPANDELHLCEEELIMPSLRPNAVAEDESAQAEPLKEFVKEKVDIPVSEAAVIHSNLAQLTEPHKSYICWPCLSREYIWSDIQAYGLEPSAPDKVRKVKLDLH